MSSTGGPCVGAGPRRLLLVITGLNSGGAETQVAHLARGFAGRGWSVRVASLTQAGPVGAALSEQGIPVMALGMEPGRPSLRGLVRLAREFRRFQPGVVHAHMVHANLAARLARVLVRVPRLVCTAHNTWEGGRARDLWYRLTDPLADVTTNVSEIGMRRYVQRRLVSPSRGRYVPNGVEVTPASLRDEARLRLRAELGLGGAFTWICVARLMPVKGHCDLIRAFATHVRACPGSRLLIAGDGPLREDLQRQISGLGLDVRALLLGNRDDIPQLLHACDAFVLASRMEGLPMAILEAMIACLPVVATNVGGVPELVAHSPASHTVPPGNPAALAEAMSEVARLPAAQRMAAAERARTRVSEHYGLNHVLDLWEELYCGAGRPTTTAGGTVV